jgi:hypothetical protein
MPHEDARLHGDNPSIGFSILLAPASGATSGLTFEKLDRRDALESSQMNQSDRRDAMRKARHDSCLPRQWRAQLLTQL